MYVGEWRFSATHSSLLPWIEMSGQLYFPALPLTSTECGLGTPYSFSNPAGDQTSVAEPVG